jgi:acyl-CoA reductase-like NAD-dependent aldehyde dehydrogenase
MSISSRIYTSEEHCKLPPAGHVVSSLTKTCSTGAGQGCIAAERFIADAAVYDDFVSILTKRVKELRAGIDVGAMINGNRLQHLQDLVEEAVSQGARLVVGGNIYTHPEFPQAHYFHPTLLCDVTNDMRIAQEECFAPIMLVLKAKVGDNTLDYENWS